MNIPDLSHLILFSSTVNIRHWADLTVTVVMKFSMTTNCYNKLLESAAGGGAGRYHEMRLRCMTAWPNAIIKLKASDMFCTDKFRLT